MQTIDASESKEKWPQWLDELNQACEAQLITKNEKPISILQPYRTLLATIYGMHNGKVVSIDELIAPSGLNWDAA